MLIGYVRVSTNDQNTDLQRNALNCRMRANTDGNITLSGTTSQPASIATDGVYIVRGIMYTGDTRGQAWYMDMICEARGAADLLSSSAQQRIYS